MYINRTRVTPNGIVDFLKWINTFDFNKSFNNYILDLHLHLELLSTLNHKPINKNNVILNLCFEPIEANLKFKLEEADFMIKCKMWTLLTWLYVRKH
jgi:hypothetical protein